MECKVHLHEFFLVAGLRQNVLCRTFDIIVKKFIHRGIKFICIAVDDHDDIQKKNKGTQSNCKNEIVI